MTSDTSININNNFQYPNLPVSIVWPENPDEVPWFMQQLYDQLAFAINSKDNGIFQMAIGDDFTLIPNMNSFGSYLINISGSGPYVDSNGILNYWGAAIFQVTKSTPTAAGTDTMTQVQVGTGPTLTGASYDLDYQEIPVGSNQFYTVIRHNIPGITGSFNVNIQGTQ